AVQKHELSTAIEPQQEHAQSHTQQDHKGRHGNDPIKMAQDITPRLFEAVTKIGPSPVRMVAGVEISAGTRTCTCLAETGQPRAKADDKPFTEVERLEQHQLH